MDPDMWPGVGPAIWSWHEAAGSSPAEQERQQSTRRAKRSPAEQRPEQPPEQPPEQKGTPVQISERSAR